MTRYVPLHLRSAYSLGRGTASVQDLVATAAGYGHEALALTDRNNLYGLLPFVNACREAGVRPIVGAEVDEPGGVPTRGTNAAVGSRRPRISGENLVVLLVRDETGYANLCQILTARMLDPGFRIPEALSRHHDGLYVLTPDPGLLRGLARMLPRGTLHAELAAPRHGSPGFAVVADAARALGLGCVATGEVNHLERADHALAATLAAVRENTVVGALAPDQLAPREAYLKAPAAMASLFRRHRDALVATRHIAENCRHVPERTGWIFPDPPLPGGETAVSHLAQLCEAGMIRRYHRRPVEAVRRLQQELAVIDRLGFSTYFVVVGEIMRFAREQDIASVGRGSGAGSLTAYLLGITNVDPIRYRLYFERFLHEKRPDCPDLDIDLCWVRRDEVIEHVYETYGRDRVAMISTHNTFQPRSAFREAARAHGVADATVNRLSRCVPHHAELPLRQALDAAPRGGEIPREPPPWPRVLDDADRLRGLPRHLGLHPGGIVISDRPLDQYVPLEEATKGILCTQFEMRAIEAVGLVKIDLLGNRALSTIQETIDLVEAGHGVQLQADAIPHTDRATADLLARGDTLGVFQMESPGMRNLNRMLRTDSLAVTIAAVALIRPGPAGSGMKDRFVRRLRGEEPVTHADPRLAPLLGDTYGVPLYEEDVMCIAAEVAGLSLEDGDVLRRAIAAREPEQVEEMTRFFLARARRRGYREETARAIWDHLLQFGAFAFCKAHAAGYGVLAWQAGWLKAHYPLEFAAAIMNHHAGMYDKRTHLEDAKRRGVRVLLPDANRSADGFVPESAGLRVGLSWVQGLSDSTRKALREVRSRRAFDSLEDFLARVPATRPETESLILAGGFDFTGRTRPELLCVVASAFAAFRRRERETSRSGRDELFTSRAGAGERWPVPSLPEFPAAERLWREWGVLGLCVGEHPMRYFRSRCVSGNVLFAREAETQVGRRVRVAGLVAARRTVPTRSGKTMQFVTLEDESGLVECTLFPGVYARHRGLVHTLGPYLAEGKIEEQHGAPTLNVQRIVRITAGGRSSHPGPGAPETPAGIPGGQDETLPVRSGSFS